MRYEQLERVARLKDRDISFLFDIRGLIKGTKEAGWLETTYISKNMRIGRGNKGSMFILTRDRDAMKESQ